VISTGPIHGSTTRINMADQAVNRFWDRLLSSTFDPVALCGDELMENDWEEGFTCTRRMGHVPPHRDESEMTVSTDNKGRRYKWAYEWTYDE
jgi:hypothetical protein